MTLLGAGYLPPAKQGALLLSKRNILCLLLAAALLVQPISLRSWADEAATEETQQETITPEEESTEATGEETTEETGEITEETEETEPIEEETVPEEIPEEAIIEESEDGRFFPDYTLDDYADVMYGDGTIKNNGCSVCCMAVAATYLTGHQDRKSVV